MREFTIDEVAECIKRFQDTGHDFVLAVIGPARSGKTTWSFALCDKVSSGFKYPDDIIMTPEDAPRVCAGTKPNKSIMVDEGAISLFSRDALRTENKDFIRTLTVVGKNGYFIAINAVDLKLLDTFVRNSRLRSIARIKLDMSKKGYPERGRILWYRLQEVKKITKDASGATKWPRAAGIIKFEGIKKISEDLYTRYQDYDKVSNNLKDKVSVGGYNNKHKSESAFEKKIVVCKERLKDLVAITKFGKPVYNLNNIMAIAGCTWKTAFKIRKRLNIDSPIINNPSINKKKVKS